MAAILDNVRARPAVPSVLVAVAIDDAVAVVQITVDPAGRASRVDVVADPRPPARDREGRIVTGTTEPTCVRCAR